MMTPPKGAFHDQIHSGTLAKVFKNPANATLRAAFEKATGADLQLSTFGETIVFSAPSREDCARVKTALTEMEAALTVPDEQLAAILKKNGF